MAFIRCTARLLKDLGIRPANIPDQTPDIFDWHANMLRLNRKKYVLFTNSQTLYSFLIRWAGRPRPAEFQEQFRLKMFQSLMSEGIAEEYIEYMLDGHKQITITKTNSRSVLGSMNDLAFQAKYMVYIKGIIDDAYLHEINRVLNQNPMSAIKYQNGTTELKRRLYERDFLE
jgi:hypothetical protein